MIEFLPLAVVRPRNVYDPSNLSIEQREIAAAIMEKGVLPKTFNDHRKAFAAWTEYLQQMDGNAFEGNPYLVEVSVSDCTVILPLYVKMLREKGKSPDYIKHHLSHLRSNWIGGNSSASFLAITSDARKRMLNAMPATEEEV